MIRTTLEWRKVADCMPDQSGEYFVLAETGYIALVGYSRKHGRFNTGDYQRTKEAQKTAIDDVVFWAPVPASLRGMIDDTKGEWQGKVGF